MKRGAGLKSDSKEPFRSKRNKVILHNGMVEKHFTSAKNAAFEASMLERLYAAGARVPRLVTREKAVLKMEYISGETIPDFLTHMEYCPDELTLYKAADNIIAWLGDFYCAVNTEKTGEIRGDVNGRNFIWDGGQCWGVDFEERATGTKEQDIGRLIAYVLSYDPPGTPVKNKLADRLLQNAVSKLGVDFKTVLQVRDREFIAMQARRDIKKEDNVKRTFVS